MNSYNVEICLNCFARLFTLGMGSEFKILDLRLDLVGQRPDGDRRVLVIADNSVRQVTTLPEENKLNLRSM
jgi:hypothetical protein